MQHPSGPAGVSMWSTAVPADFRSMNRSRIRRAALLAAITLAVSAAPANATTLVKTTTDCGAPVLTQPFLPWGDQAFYKLVDGGSFESGAPGWDLRGGARVAGAALSLPPGSSAVSAPVCVGHDEPTMRFFAAGARSSLSVAVQFELVTGTRVTLPIGLDAGGSWAPSPIMHILANLLPPRG